MTQSKANKQNEALHSFKMKDIRRMSTNDLWDRKENLLSEMNNKSFAILNTDLRGLRRHKEQNFANEQIERMRDELEAVEDELITRG